MTTMLYRSAEEPNEAVWGLPVEYCVFDDDDVAGHLENGWFAHPDDVPEADDEPLLPLDPEPVKRGPGRPPKAKDEA